MGADALDDFELKTLSFDPRRTRASTEERAIMHRSDNPIRSILVEIIVALYFVSNNST